jgi:probable phosphoglycerate mutase
MAADPPELWLARHGETEWTIARRHTGSTDVPLTDNGREQARALAGSLEGVKFDLVLSSPLSRAEETARLVGLEATPEPRLVEWDYGEYEGRTTAEIRAERPDWDLWRDGCPGGETPEAIARRLEPLVEELRPRRGKRIALFGHGHCLRALTGCWLGLGVEGGRWLALGTASLSRLGCEHGNPVVTLWNQQNHAPSDGRRSS